MNCDTTDFMYPMLADVYYPIITQSEYGKAIKEWIFDRTITCNAQSVNQKANEDTSPAVFLVSEGKLIARSKSDIRSSSKNENNNITNILITNIRLPGDNLVYRETAGPRSGRGTTLPMPVVVGQQRRDQEHKQFPELKCLSQWRPSRLLWRCTGIPSHSLPHST
jgi:hypothetical protein